ncbi:alkylation response protein AidB-like acyl-CoA dehydrogenase [Actinoplanes lutulentus]|uniref:Dibenzothiophene monooxygenase n=1 Tax=Actinoplanes lutulentus TaxID=1287878 RepID=A0A327ZB08_9ACTN|nr:acyl-CoA dehydrogenase family protein [Actinoplanes lutulentus]MBB2949228.1 alkylation response protein AidB-like acyl-CoA dehydrogenase [Actinoplanes lutulentus]RAK34622.1 alkylation response protein AidB-like acyl-CoA dehydrogenase [Actinoplanes lutulentus]
MLTHDQAVTTAHRLAAELEPGAIQRDRDGATVIPSDALAAVDASGLLGITVPAADGGSGLGPRTLAEVTRILAAADPAIAQVPQGHFLMIDILAVHGSSAVRKSLFADVLAGKRIGNGLAERGGKHAQDLKTRISDGVLNGVKYYTTGALTSAWIAVSALDAAGRLVLAFVPRSAPGVTVDTDWDVIGQRATISGTATFRDVAVSHVIDYASAYEVPQQLGARAQLVHTAIETGIAGAALRDARSYLRSTARPSSETIRAGHNSVAADPHVRHRYGRIASRVQAAEALLAAAAGTLDEIGLVPASAADAARGSLTVAAAKAFASETALEAASELFTLCGTSAAAAKWDLDRHWRNARTHSIHDPIDYKYAHIGAYELADVLPPNHGQI